ncbi:hydrogenase maturation nickel metallochaperone HypA [Brevibacillus thermoruber]|uniref:Hydrogenase maturation nickel metallochaperone HypA n=1 Tax=Brevibacillus thermoruber TaxID=33942 RepID=A0A9X3TMB5_9BACL|nr:hydrogenase maturation nickel metallochaperone HypA [Brevibacillus thermoruber]MDA5107076.1 hydrogenase maturation nickel metallochaperone HypA [Brevibacillus thermoruber]
MVGEGTTKPGDNVHEVGLAAEILAIVQHAAQKAGMTTVTRIKVVVGEQLMVIPEALQFAFSFIKENSCARKAALEIGSTSGREMYVDYVEGE